MLEFLFLFAQVHITDGRAVGVEMTKGGQQHNIRANREVILSAGVIGSAQLLMLSGVGPKEDLEKLKVSTFKYTVNANWSMYSLGLFAIIK